MFFSSRIHRTLPRRFGALVLSGALAASFAGFALANPASAAHVEGVPYEGNLSCAEAELPVVEGAEATWLELKVEAGQMQDSPADLDGESIHEGPSGLEITIKNATPQTFDWTSNLDLVAVLVKGGTGGGGLRYDYPGATDGLLDTGLHAPSLAEGVAVYHDISHVSFCFVVVETTNEPVIQEETKTSVDVQPAAAAPAPEVVAAQPEAVKTTVLGETLVRGDTLPRTGAAATNTLALAGGLGLAFGLLMLMLARRKTAIHSS